MRRVTAATAVLVGLALAIGATPALGRPAITGPLGKAGRWIVDREGRVVVLHGFNVVPKRAPYRADAFGYGADDAAFLAGEGFNTVRLGLVYRALERRPGRISRRYLNAVARTVDVNRRNGLLTLLDFHQDLFNERFGGGEGFPDWATLTDGLPEKPDLGFAGNFAANRAVHRAFESFWANRRGPAGVRLQTRYARALTAVARQFRSEPSLVGYDVFNEPFPGSTWQACIRLEGCPEFENGPLTAFFRRAFTALRRVDRTHLAWYEPTNLTNFGNRPFVGPTGDRLAGLAFHVYCLASGGGGVGPNTPNVDAQCAAPERRALRHGLKLARANGGDAALVGEWGAAGEPGTLGRMARELDDEMLSWQNWSYDNVLPETGRAAERPDDPQSVIRDRRRPPTRANVRNDKLAILARPYPQAVAGTPRWWRFRLASRVFTFSYVTRRAGGGRLPRGLSTLVAIPRRQYSRGYRVRARGARVVSGPGAAVLKLVALPHARRVSVTVSPR